MKSVFILFDTLMKDVLTSYNEQSIVKTPNFDRLKDKTIQFNKFYAGSLPCMPARREIHTGRYNFLHRAWGPLEPFDDSMIEILGKNGIYTHLVTDHSHYFEDGGATYHNRYTSYEGFRGQEGDRYLPTLAFNDMPTDRPKTSKKGYSVKQHYVNRTVQQEEEDYSSVKTINAGIDFLNKHHDCDNWFLQIECFDPHEPFYAPERFRKLYTDTTSDQAFDWPAYKPLTETDEELTEIRNEYFALVSMCDEYLGKVLDVFDTHNLWNDTLLLVGTDHGILLGEHNWIGKNIAPMFNEIANTPFFMHIPNSNTAKTSDLLAQTIDIAPTVLDYFGIEATEHMQGKSILKALKTGEKNHEFALYGVFGCHVNITDGKYTYMRATNDIDSEEIYNYTLMPTNMRGFFADKLLKEATLTSEFAFTKGIPVLKTKGKPMISSLIYGNMLFDVENDSKQKTKLSNPEIEIYMINSLCKELENSQAPAELYKRLGLEKGKIQTLQDCMNSKTSKKLLENLNHTDNRKVIFLASFLKERDEFLEIINEEILKEGNLSKEFFAKCLDYVVEKSALKKRKQQLVNILNNMEKI